MSPNRPKLVVLFTVSVRGRLREKERMKRSRNLIRSRQGTGRDLLLYMAFHITKNKHEKHKNFTYETKKGIGI